MVFAVLQDLSADRTLDAVHEIIAIVRHLSGLTADERDRIAHERAKVTGHAETEIALDVVREIEMRERKPLAEIDPDTVEDYLGELADLAWQRIWAERPSDPERGRELLEKLRRESAV